MHSASYGFKGGISDFSRGRGGRRKKEEGGREEKQAKHSLENGDSGVDLRTLDDPLG